MDGHLTARVMIDDRLRGCIREALGPGQDHSTWGNAEATGRDSALVPNPRPRNYLKERANFSGGQAL